MSNQTESREARRTEHVTIFQIGMLVLSVYVIAALSAQTFLDLPVAVQSLLDRIDVLVCVIFLSDVAYRFWKAENKLQFLKWGWIDVISSIPTVDFLRWGRLVRVFRILRILRAFRSTKMLVAFLFRNRARGAFMSAAFISILLLIFSSIALLSFETDPSSNIKTPSDALWWGVATITTVGYGDRYPVTIEGRIVAVVLMIAGVGLFGTFTAYVAALFIEPEQRKEENEIGELRKEIALLREKLESMDRRMR